MDEYIKREALIAEFKRLKLGENGLIERIFADGVYTVLETFQSEDVAPVVHGKWDFKVGMNTYKERICTVCKKHIESNFWNFCPNCGAKMDGCDSDVVD